MEKLMGSLIQNRKNFQLLCRIMKSMLGVEVFVVDEDMIAIAGTGPYRKNIGTRRPRDSYVDVTIHSGICSVIKEPRYTNQCYRCEYRSVCPYTMVICNPIRVDDKIQGLIGFLGYDESQRGTMIKHASFLEKLSKEISLLLAGFLKNNIMDINGFLSHPYARDLINTFDDGIVITTPDKVVLNLNQKAEHILCLKGDNLVGRNVKELNINMEAIKSNVISNITKNNASIDSGDTIYTINEGGKTAGYLIVLNDRKRLRKSRHFSSSTHNTDSSYDKPVIIGRSPSITHLKEQAAKVAKSNNTVLIIGETGTGKELLARYIHALSDRRSHPFVITNCSAIPDSLFESEMFGYEPGAFTGASKKGKIGKFELANRGTIFLDEVGRLSLVNQAKILRILEDGSVEKLGGNHPIQIDVRIIAATNRPLESLVQENRFLPDLYYRLAVIPLYIPPLRERIEDIPLLLEYFTNRLLDKNPHKDFMGFDMECLSYIFSYDWPGNIRQFKNLIEYVFTMVEGRYVTLDDLPPYLRESYSPKYAKSTSKKPKNTLAVAEHFLIQQALERFGRNTFGKRQAAKHLGISLSTLYRKLAEMKTHKPSVDKNLIL